jgi:quercetin dioxygenase-like cupin family protein
MGPELQTKIKDVRAESGPAVSVVGWRIAYLEEPADNGDACLLYEARSASGAVIPPHREDNHEAFYILEGEFEFHVEGVSQRYGTGDFLRIAPGLLHSVTNVGPGWGRILFMVSPGRQHQRLFDTLGTPLEPHQDPQPLIEPPDFATIATAGEASGIHFVPPPNDA